jgi:hypothetical protein
LLAFIVQDLPLAVTLLPVILDPPLFDGSDIETVIVIFPFLAFEKVTAVIVGAEGLEIAA